MKPTVINRSPADAGSVAAGMDAGAVAAQPAMRASLAALALSMLLASLGVSIANVALPTLVQAFGASFQEVQWVVLAYLLASTVLIVGVGRLGDLAGHRRVLLAGILIFTAASALCGVAVELWMLIAARVAQGLGAAILMALAVALVRDTVPKERTGSAMGLLGTMSAIGTALGPSLGGVLIAGPGWRAIFFAMAGLGIAGFLIAYRFLPADRERPEKSLGKFDFAGTLLLGLTLGTYALAMTVGRGRFDWMNMALLSATVLGCSAFFMIEARAASPLIRLSAFRDATLSGGLAANVLVATVMMATLVVGPFYLSQALGLSEAAVGAVLSAGPIISALTGIPAGRIVDRLGARFVSMAGLGAMSAGAALLTVLPAMLGAAGYVAAIAILTPGYQLFQAANNTAVMADVRADQRGVISGMLSLSRNLGLITGASAMGALFAWATSGNGVAGADPVAVTAGMRITFAVATALVIIAMVGVAGSDVLARHRRRG